MVFKSDWAVSWRPRIDFYRSQEELGQKEPYKSILIKRAVFALGKVVRKQKTITVTTKNKESLIRVHDKVADEWMADLAVSSLQALSLQV